MGVGDQDSTDSGLPTDSSGGVPDFNLPEKAFDFFCTADKLSSVTSSFNRMCDLLNINPADDSNVQVSFYRILRKKLAGHWKARQLFGILDKRVQLKVYKRHHSYQMTKALVIGAGPAGLRCAIELALIGSKVVVIEKRDSFSRNNVLHLWPFLLHDLKALGAKILFGMFCSGSLDHISIRTLQCILLKICLILGVQVFFSVEFSGLVEPERDKGNSWRAKLIPSGHFLSSFEFNILIGASGKQFSLEGFKRKVFRGTLAIAITVNFVNKHTPAEIKVAEISGVAVIYNQKFFKDLFARTGIDLENIVYYKNETHYFVMTAKKSSLLAKNVLRKDCDNPGDLLHPKNICREALYAYALEAANFSTQYQLPNLEFALTQTGQPDVAVFDFTNIFQAENSTRYLERGGQPLLMSLIGDSLLEPFWPTGSGCARGFLSALDAGWMVRRFTRGNRHILDILAERESIYQRLSQTEPRNIAQNFSKYTLDPRTRYPTLNLGFLQAAEMRALVDTDDPLFNYTATCGSPNKRRMSSKPTTVASHNQRHHHHGLLPRRSSGGGGSSREHESLDLSLSLDTGSRGAGGSQSLVAYASLVRWFQIKLDRYSSQGLAAVTDLSSSWRSGHALLCLLHAFKPDLIDPSLIEEANTQANLKLAFLLYEREFGVEPVSSVEELLSSDSDQSEFATYLKRVYEKLRCLTPYRAVVKVSAVESRITGHIARHNRPSSYHNQTRHKTNTSMPIKRIEQTSTPQSSIFNQRGVIGRRRDELLSAFDESNKQVRLQKVTAISPATSNVSQLQHKLFGSRDKADQNKNNPNPPSYVTLQRMQRCFSDFLRGLCSQSEEDTEQSSKDNARSHRSVSTGVLPTALHLYKKKVFNSRALTATSEIEQPKGTAGDPPSKASSSPPTGRYRSGTAPERKSSSVRRSKAFLVVNQPVQPTPPPNAPALALEKREDRQRSCSEPQAPQATQLLYEHRPTVSLPDDEIASVTSVEAWKPLDRVLSWEDALARCRSLRGTDQVDNSAPDAASPQSPSIGAALTTLRDVIPIPPPRTVFLDVDADNKGDDPDEEDIVLADLEPKVIVIGGTDTSRLSSITECDTLLERSRTDTASVAVPNATLTGIETLPPDDDATLRSDHYANNGGTQQQGSLNTSMRGTFAAEKGRKKVSPLYRFESLVRDVEQLRRDSVQQEEGPIYDTPCVEESQKRRRVMPAVRQVSSPTFSSDSSELEVEWEHVGHDLLSHFDPARDEDPNLTWRGGGQNQNGRLGKGGTPPSVLKKSQKPPTPVASSGNKAKKASKFRGLFRGKKKNSLGEIGVESFQQQRQQKEIVDDLGGVDRAQSIDLDYGEKPTRGLRKFKSEGNLHDDGDSSFDPYLDDGITPWSSSASLGYSPSEEDTTTAAAYDMDPATTTGRRNIQLLRLRQAQEIQRQLQEVEVLLAELELKGADAENRIRRVKFLRSQAKDDDPANAQHTDELEHRLHDEILVNVAEKNQLVRFESELTIQAKELELEDRQNRLKEDYSRRVEISDKHKTKEQMVEDKKVLQEYLQVVEERNSLVLLLDEQRQREETEDSHLLDALARRGIHFFPMSYVTKIRSGTTQESHLI